MLKFDEQVFRHFMLDHAVVGVFDKPIVLKSGQLSNWYVNWRTVAEDVFLMDSLTDFVLTFVDQKRLAVDTFFGVAEGASKLGVLLQYKWAKRSPDYGMGSHRLAMGRGQIKNHGASTDRKYLGLPTGRVCVLEDVTTTAGSLIETIVGLRQDQVNVVGALSLTDRQAKLSDGQTAKQRVEALGVPFYTLSRASEFIPDLVNSLGTRAPQDFLTEVRALNWA